MTISDGLKDTHGPDAWTDNVFVQIARVELIEGKNDGEALAAEIQSSMSEMRMEGEAHQTDGNKELPNMWTFPPTHPTKRG